MFVSEKKHASSFTIQGVRQVFLQTVNSGKNRHETGGFLRMIIAAIPLLL
jgi:hypothetical protein